MNPDLIVQAAREAGFHRVESCCGIENKFCNSDVWHGNLEGFAKAIVRLQGQQSVTRMFDALAEGKR